MTYERTNQALGMGQTQALVSGWRQLQHDRPAQWSQPQHYRSARAEAQMGGATAGNPGYPRNRLSPSISSLPAIVRKHSNRICSAFECFQDARTCDRYKSKIVGRVRLLSKSDRYPAPGCEIFHTSLNYSNTISLEEAIAETHNTRSNCSVQSNDS